MVSLAHPLLASMFALAAAGSPWQARPILPAGPAARALAGVGPQTPAQDLGRALPELAALLRAPAPWEVAETWELWAKLVEAEAGAGEPDPSRRAALSLLARAQGRDGDAWTHLAAAGAEPGWVAAVLPHLWPGIAGDASPAPGGRPAPLAGGALLAPALPPDAREVLRGQSPRSEMMLRGLEVGAGKIDLRLVLEPTGVELELVHAGGEPVVLDLLLPTPPGRELRLVYLDWMRQETAGVQRVEVSATDEHPRQLYGRFELRREPLPASPAGAAPAGLALGGLYLMPRVGESEPLLEAAASALGRLARVPSGVHGPLERAGAGARAFDGIVVELPEGAARARALARVAAAAEAWRLARPDR